MILRILYRRRLARAGVSEPVWAIGILLCNCFGQRLVFLRHASPSLILKGKKKDQWSDEDGRHGISVIRW